MADISVEIILVQALGFVALALGVRAFLSHDDRRLKLFLTAQSLVLCVHFFLLGAGGGAAASLITGIRNFSSLFAKVKHAAPLFIAFYVAFGVYSYQSWTDALPICGSIISTIGFFYLNKIPMRLCALCATSLWLVHNMAVGSIGPLLMELLIFTANVKTIYALRQNSRV
ncbi:MAG: permease [Micavibrio sp.]|nr:permease [Micavibrio sp.]|tara:strand:- start:4672 stop:5181 length:510 start_codon:yes stop_codon:yes gene_type:complete